MCFLLFSRTKPKQNSKSQPQNQNAEASKYKNAKSQRQGPERIYIYIYRERERERERERVDSLFQESQNSHRIERTSLNPEFKHLTSKSSNETTAYLKIKRKIRVTRGDSTITS